MAVRQQIINILENIDTQSISEIVLKIAQCFFFKGCRISLHVRLTTNLY